MPQTAPASTGTVAAAAQPTTSPSQPATTVVTAAATGAQPQPGGTLRFGLSGDLTSLDPHVIVPGGFDTLWQVYDRLAEIGDDRTRFTDAHGLKAYAGATPVTRASGKSLLVRHRRVKNQRLAAVGYVWTFAALRASPGARAHYDRRRAAGDRHAAAQRHLFNRFLGCLYHCLQTRQLYAEDQAFPATLDIAA